jgi:hypothetical protein
MTPRTIHPLPALPLVERPGRGDAAHRAVQEDYVGIGYEVTVRFVVVRDAKERANTGAIALAVDMDGHEADSAIHLPGVADLDSVGELVDDTLGRLADRLEEADRHAPRYVLLKETSGMGGARGPQFAAHDGSAIRAVADSRTAAFAVSWQPLAWHVLRFHALRLRRAQGPRCRISRCAVGGAFAAATSTNGSSRRFADEQGRAHDVSRRDEERGTNR